VHSNQSVSDLPLTPSLDLYGVWHEWFHGLDGNLSIEAREARFGTSWRRRPPTSRLYYPRRKLVLGIQRVMELLHTASHVDAIAYIERVRDNLGKRGLSWLHLNIHRVVRQIKSELTSRKGRAQM
jgi:hypothetical protein